MLTDRRAVLVVAEQLRRAVPGGIGTYVRGLVGGLAALGPGGAPPVALYASRAPGGSDPLGALGRPVRTSRLPGPLLAAAWERDLASAPGGFGVVHCPSLAVPPSRAPVVVAVHDLAWRRVPEAYPRRGRRWHEAALARVLERGAAFLVPSVATAEDLLAAGAEPERVVLSELGCDHLPPADAAGAAALLRRLGVGDGYLLSVGTLEPRKNLPRLIAAYARARPQLAEPWPLVVVGPAGWGEAVRPAPGVLMAGSVDDAVLAALYAGARCLAYVPLLEGFGLPAAEAMYACTPVVASPLPSAGAAALEVDPTDVDAIADALVRASGDDRLRSSLVTAGLLRAGELTWAATARRHVAVWDRVAGP